jgi:hypothetical protein
MMRFVLPVIAIVGILMGFHQPALAQGDCDTPPRPMGFEQLVDLEMKGCYNATQTGTLANWTRECMAGKTCAGEFSPRIRSVLDRLAIELDASRRAAPPAAQAPLVALQKKVDMLPNLVDKPERPPELDAQAWRFDRDTGRVGETDVNLQASLDADCPAPEDKCQQAFQAAVASLRVAKALEELGRHLDPVSWSAFSDRYGPVAERWKNYLFKARVQYWWEMAANGALFDANRDPKAAFPEPPTYQLILAHPSVALEYVGDADDGNEFEPAVVVEWIGYNFWTWQGTEMKRPLGVSIVSTLSDRAGTDDLGHGLLFHYKHTYSLGVTWREGDVGIFASFDLGKYLLDRKSQLESAREKFKVKFLRD